MKLNERLKELRIIKGLSRQQLAEQTGISIHTIASYEKGQREPNSKAMAILEQFFNVSGKYLRGEDDKKNLIDYVEGDTIIFSKMLAERIKTARGSLSLRSFAKMCGLSHSYLSSIERGIDPRNNKPIGVSWETLEKLSAGTGYTIEQLMGIRNNPFIDQPTIKKQDPPLTIEEIRVFTERMKGRPLTSTEKAELSIRLDDLKSSIDRIIKS